MARGLTAAGLAQITGSDARPALLFEGVFESGTVRFWSGVGEINYNSQTWYGSGNLISISPVEETADVVSGGLSVELNGVPSQLVEIALKQARQNSRGRVWLALMGADGRSVVSASLLFDGLLDQPVIEDDGDTCRIEIRYANHLADLLRPREWRYTDEHQQQLSPGDRGLEFVAGLQEKEISWGRN